MKSPPLYFQIGGASETHGPRAATVREGVNLATQVLAPLEAGDTEPRAWAIASGRGFQLALGYETLLSVALNQIGGNVENRIGVLDHLHRVTVEALDSEQFQTDAAFEQIVYDDDEGSGD